MNKFFAVLCCLALAGCATTREVLPVHHESSRLAACMASELEARERGGESYCLTPTGSMEPTLHGGDFLVSVPTPFEELTLGMIVNYLTARNRLTCHRLLRMWRIGVFIVEGDTPVNKAATRYFVSANNYVNHVVAVYRFP